MLKYYQLVHSQTGWSIHIQLPSIMVTWPYNFLTCLMLVPVVTLLILSAFGISSVFKLLFTDLACTKNGSQQLFWRNSYLFRNNFLWCEQIVNVPLSVDKSVTKYSEISFLSSSVIFLILKGFFLGGGILSLVASILCMLNNCSRFKIHFNICYRNNCCNDLKCSLKATNIYIYSNSLLTLYMMKIAHMALSLRKKL